MKRRAQPLFLMTLCLALLIGLVLSIPRLFNSDVDPLELGINSLAINGHPVMLAEGQDNFTLLLAKSADMNKLTVDFSIEEKSKLMIGTTELISGESYKFDAIQEITLLSDDNESKKYQVSVIKVDRIADTGLPTVVIQTVNNKAIVDKVNNVQASMTIIDGSTMQYGKGLYNGVITIRGRGNSSWDMPKKSYKISPPINAEMLDMPKHDDWVLIANYADKTLMRNYIAYELSRSLGMAYSPTMRFVELVLNGKYLGNYLLGEQIKIAEDRVNINKLKNTDNSGIEVTGGYLIEKDWLDRLDPDENYFTTRRIKGGDVFNIKAPNSSKITREQQAYIANYFQEAEDSLYGADFADPVLGYQQYYDVDSFINWFIVNELFKNVDAGFGTSCYLYVDRGGKIHFGPVWDFDLGAGNANYNGADEPTGFYVKNGQWISRFFEDPAMSQRLIERWAEISDEQIPAMFTLIRNTEQMLEQSAVQNFSKWILLGKYTWPNADGYEQRKTYSSEVDFMIDWLEQRIAWLNESIPNL